MSSSRPCLAINSSQDFSVLIELLGVQTYNAASREYRFNFGCRALHPTGEFTYTARDIYFDPETFREFVRQLDSIRSGKGSSAKFHDHGQMIVFLIEVRGRTASASLRIREYQPHAEQTVLSLGFPVDYDLFVNALHRKTAEFLSELAEIND